MKKTRKKPQDRNAGTAASKKFSRYKKEDEKAVRKTDVRQDKVLEQLKRAFKAINIFDELAKDGDIRLSDAYEAISTASVVTSLRCSSKDIEKFSLVLVEFQRERWFSDKAGLFLSALINNGDDNDYMIHTANLEWSVGNLGYKNTKNIVVRGDVGDNIGESMGGGTITVEGDACNFVGYWMEGGDIRIRGNVDEMAGWLMKGGTITVEGDAGISVGYGMFGGVIHLEGGYSDIGDRIKGGKIYHKGELIVDK